MSPFQYFYESAVSVQIYALQMFLFYDKYHEAYHLLKFANEKQILEKAYNEYLDLKKCNLWGTHKYY